jgi:hypothetical protein
MLKTQSFIFLQLQKTGCTHVEHLIRMHYDVEAGMKHKRLPKTSADARLPVLGGVRNPWDWYVSFYAYGCERRGGITNAYLLADGFSAPRWISVRNRLKNVTPTALLRRTPAFLTREATHRRAPWNAVMSDVDDVENFRRYMKMLFDPRHAFAAAMDYGFSPHRRDIGLFSYLYLWLYLRSHDQLFEADGAVAHALRDPGTLDAALAVTHFIPMEALETSLVSALEEIGVRKMAGVSTKGVKEARTNSSKRMPDYRHYYDDETRALVASRDRLIIERHGYVF